MENMPKWIKQNNESIHDKSSFIWKQIFEYNKTINMTQSWKFASKG